MDPVTPMRLPRPIISMAALPISPPSTSRRSSLSTNNLGGTSGSRRSSLSVDTRSPPMRRNTSRTFHGYLEVPMKWPAGEDRIRDQSLGIAFSGGGIRSAAFCSGVLCRLLSKTGKDAAAPDYMSCVSGGGYLGGSLSHWIKMNGTTQIRDWLPSYFSHFQKNVGYFCNFSSSVFRCFSDCLIFIMCLMLWLILVMLLLMPYAFPLAIAVDHVLGDTLRNDSTNIVEIWKFLVIPISAFGVFYIMERLLKSCYGTTYETEGGKCVKYLMDICRLLGLIALGIELLVILLFFDHATTDAYLDEVVQIMVIIIWFKRLGGLTKSNKGVGFVVVLWFYARIIEWRVYVESDHTPFFSIVCDDQSRAIFQVCYQVAVFFLLLAPFIVRWENDWIHFFYRWRLQQAFFDPRDALIHGCGCMCGGMQNACLLNPFKRCCKSGFAVKDLKGTAPLYLPAMTVNRWSHLTARKKSEPHSHSAHIRPELRHAAGKLAKTPSNPNSPKLRPLSAKRRNSSVFVLEPHKWYRTDEASKRGFEPIFNLRNMQVSDVMALSASAIQEGVGNFRWIWLRKRKRLTSFLVYFILFGLPLVITAVWTELDWLVWVPLFLSIIIVCLAVPPAHRRKSAFDRFRRLFNSLSLIVFIQGCLGFVYESEHTGAGSDYFPDVLPITDGGHTDNLGALPLLAKRLKSIIICDGTTDEEESCQALTKLINIAREELRISFHSVKLSTDGEEVTDIEQDLVENMVACGGFQEPPRYFRFKVQYARDLYGDVIYLKPRLSERRFHQLDGEWRDQVELFADKSGKNHIHDTSDIPYNDLDGCCCDCCHGLILCRLVRMCWGKFPHHGPQNQYFTQALFNAYHEAGFHSLSEAVKDGAFQITNDESIAADDSPSHRPHVSPRRNSMSISRRRESFSVLTLRVPQIQHLRGHQRRTSEPQVLRGQNQRRTSEPFVQRSSPRRSPHTPRQGSPPSTPGAQRGHSRRLSLPATVSTQSSSTPISSTPISSTPISPSYNQQMSQPVGSATPKRFNFNQTKRGSSVKRSKVRQKDGNRQSRPRSRKKKHRRTQSEGPRMYSSGKKQSLSEDRRPKRSRKTPEKNGNYEEEEKVNNVDDIVVHV